MKNLGHVSVILSVYSGDSLDAFTDAYESMQGQSYPYCDIYIKVDGEISAELNAYIKAINTSNVFVYWREENCGLAISMNELIDEVLRAEKYEFIARMDADDISLSDRIEKQVAYLKNRQEVDVLGGGCIEFSVNGEWGLKKILLPDHESLKKNIVAKTPFIHPTVMFRSRVFESGVRYPVNTHLSEDIALWCDCLVRGFRFANIPDVLLYYRVSNELLKRRAGFKKAWSEAGVRLSAIRLLGQHNVKNYFYVIAFFVLRVAPNNFIRFAYKYFR